MSRRRSLGPGLALAFGLGTACLAGEGIGGAPRPNLGLEGRLTVELPKADYRPRPLDDRTELILRVESVGPTNGQFRYDFHYLGFEPGRYSLAEFLVRPDGSRPEELKDVHLEVRALLPEDHNGQLNPYQPRRFPFIGGYRAFLGVLAVIWAGGLAGLVVRRRRRPMAPEPLAPSGPTLAERLQPLVEDAAAGRLGVEGQAQLERLLTGYWRERLALPEGRMVEAVQQLKAHPKAGEMLRALERWLHQPGGATASEVAALLEPYRHLAARAPRPGGAP